MLQGLGVVGSMVMYRHKCYARVVLDIVLILL